MKEADARHALLIRAFETAPATPQWDEEDREWASRSAAQIEGEKASAEAFVARRAGLAAERLASRVPAVAHTLAAVVWRPWAGWLVVAAAFLAGVLLDAVSAEQRINILAPPLLAVLLWNALVYLLLVFRRLIFRPPPARPMQRLVARLIHGLPKSLLKADAGGPLAVFVRQWLQASAGLSNTRMMAVLHFAAAAFAVGALAGLYTRGLAFEYLAGWESTFLSVDTVSRLLQAVLGPASFLTGIALPDASRLASIRLPAGSGENAAGWIHLYAVTLLLAVVVPRALLGFLAALRARQLAADLPIALDDGYFQNLRRRHSGTAAQVQVIPYSYQPTTGSTGGVSRLVQQIYGAETKVAVAPTVALGGEDHLGARLAGAGPVTATIALFSLAATPEVENHGAFVAALDAALPAQAVVIALVDESAFLRRFGADSQRLAERRAIWRRILASRVDIEPVFAALEDEDLSEASRKLAEVVAGISGRMVQNARFRAGAKASA